MALKINYDAEKDVLTIGELVINNDIVAQLEHIQQISHYINKSLTKAVIEMAMELADDDPKFKDESDRGNFFTNMKYLLELTDSLNESLPYEKKHKA